MAALHGYTAPDVINCRVLEVGCGDGTNLIAMAPQMPRSRFTGIDLAERPIAIGKALIERAGIKNVEISAMDLMAFPADRKEFDYIIAHGFCSWVPDFVFERFLEICRDHLSANGVVFASYNTHPAGHFREAAARAMRFHLRRTDRDGDPGEGILILEQLHDAAASEPWKTVLGTELQRLRSKDRNVIVHDDLSPAQTFFYLSEFVERAARHGLRFLGDASMRDLTPEGLSAESISQFRTLAGDDEVAFQQYLDIAGFRGFRRTLLCRANSAPREGRLRGLGMASPLRYAATGADGTSTFRNSRGKGDISTNDGPLVELLKRLEKIWPQSLPFDGDGELEARVLALAAAGLVDVRSFALAVANKPGPRPVASPLARAQAKSGPLMTTMLHSTVEIKDPGAREFLQSLDGSRRLEDLAAMIMLLQPGLPLSAATKQVNDTLEQFCRMGLMLA